MSWLAALLLAQSAPAATPPARPATLRVRAVARILAPARIGARRVEAGSTPQIRDRLRVRLVEFQ